MNQPLDLNLASRPFRNNTWIWIGLLLGVVLVGLASWSNYSTWQAESTELAELRQSVATIDSRIAELGRRELAAGRGVKNHDLELLDSQAIKANDVIMLKAFSWTRLFNRLEDLQPYEVRMLAILPEFSLGKKRSRGAENTTSTGDLEAQSVMVRVEGTAKDLNAFLELETALLNDPWFDQIEPERYSRTINQETEFSLKFQYFPNKKPEEAPLVEEAEKEEESPEGAAAEAESKIAMNSTEARS